MVAPRSSKARSITGMGSSPSAHGATATAIGTGRPSAPDGRRLGGTALPFRTWVGPGVGGDQVVQFLGDLPPQRLRLQDDRLGPETQDPALDLLGPGDPELRQDTAVGLRRQP